MARRHRDIARLHSSGTTHTDILTYRYNGQFVYVPVAPNYNQALSHAREAFPQLKDLCDASLSLSLTAPTPGTHAHNCIGISALAWPKLVAHMSRYQIVDVHVTGPQARAAVPPRIPDITITYADAEDARAIESDPAPPYQGSDDDRDVGDEKAACSPPTRTRSPSAALHSKRSWFLQRLTGQ